MAIKSFGALKPTSTASAGAGVAPPATAQSAAFAAANLALWNALPPSGGMTAAQFMALPLADQFTAYKKGTVSQGTLNGLLQQIAPGSAPVTPQQFFLTTPMLVRTGQALGRIPQDTGELGLLSIAAALNPQATSVADLQAIQLQNQLAASSAAVGSVRDFKTGVMVPVTKVAFPANPLAGIAQSTIHAAANGNAGAAQTILDTVSGARSGDPSSTRMADAFTTAGKLQVLGKYVAKYFGPQVGQQVQQGSNLSIAHATGT